MQEQNDGKLVRAGSWHIFVIVPARDEEQLLPRCLASIIRAKSALPIEVTCKIMVAIDSSTDDSFRVCQQTLQGHGTAILVNESVVGAARAVAVRCALASYRGLLEKCWLANTDADCVVPEDWLTRQYHIAVSGLQAVAGIIDVDDFSEHQPSVRDRFRATYLLGSDGRHQHVHGANLGVRADMYSQAGGWPSLKTSEDHALWQRLNLVHARIASDSNLVVVTSGRRRGRAPHGFAEALSALNTD